MTASNATATRQAVLPTAALTFGFPVWREGVLPNLANSVVIIREPAADIACTAAIPKNWTYKRVLHDYVSIRAFRSHEDGKVAMTFEVHDNGATLIAESRCIGRRTGRKNSLSFRVHDMQWVKLLRQGTPNIVRTVKPWGQGLPSNLKVLVK
jgi:hypothetical protein